MRKNEKGFSVTKFLLIIAVLGISAGLAFIIYTKNKDTKTPAPEATTSSAGQTSKNTNEANAPKSAATQKDTTTSLAYLEIPEMGIRIKLTDTIKDAYYYSKDKDTAVLSTHSLDKYPGCIASKTNPGLAAISTFKEGDSNPIEGDLVTAYPNAPKIGDTYYRTQGNQYDCSDGKDTELYTKVRRELVDSYKTIEKL